MTCLTLIVWTTSEGLGAIQCQSVLGQRYETLTTSKTHLVRHGYSGCHIHSCLSGTYYIVELHGTSQFLWTSQPFLQASETPRAPRTARPPFGPRPVADHCDADDRHRRSLVWRPSPAAVLWTCWQLTPLRKDVGQHNLCSVHGWKTSAAKNHPDLRHPVVHQKRAERDPLGRSSRSLGWYEPVRQHMASEVEAKADWRPPGRTSDLSGVTVKLK